MSYDFASSLSWLFLPTSVSRAQEGNACMVPPGFAARRPVKAACADAVRSGEITAALEPLALLLNAWDNFHDYTVMMQLRSGAAPSATAPFCS
ncbi:hypothetical protein AB0B40_10365 [Streptomyces sp. NPDC042638]|uniref:hypothetical protein n=1 Tax=Streptomyces sp. NPDC042638 TaxID=3154333 RepID=UPI0033F30389